MRAFGSILWGTNKRYHFADRFRYEDRLIEERRDGQRWRQPSLYLGQQFFYALDDVERRCITILQNGQESSALAILPNDVDLRCVAKAHLRHILHGDDRSVIGTDGKVIQRRNLRRGRVHLHDEFAVTHARHASGQDQVLLIECRRHIGCRDVVGVHEVGVHIDLHLPYLASIGERERSTLDIRKPGPDERLAQVIEIFFGHALSGQS